jgi:ribonuclease E
MTQDQDIAEERKKDEKTRVAAGKRAAGNRRKASSGEAGEVEKRGAGSPGNDPAGGMAPEGNPPAGNLEADAQPADGAKPARRRASRTVRTARTDGALPPTEGGDAVRKTGTRRRAVKKASGDAPVPDAAIPFAPPPGDPPREETPPSLPPGAQPLALPAASAEVPARPPVLSVPFADDEPVTHILPFPDGDDLSRRRRLRRRSRHNAEDSPVQRDIQPSLTSDALAADGDFPDARSRRRRNHKKYRNDRPAPGFASQPTPYDMFSSSAVSASVLLSGDSFASPDGFPIVPEDDGPQPDLPDPFAPVSLEDEDLAALDEKVNGNRAGGPERPGRARRGAAAAGESSSRADSDSGSLDERLRGQLLSPSVSRSRGDGWSAPPLPGAREQNGRSRAFREKAGAAPQPAAPPAGKNASPEAETPEPASRRILYVSVVPDEQVEVVITDNGLVTEYFVEMAHQTKIRGNIYKGVISNVDANLQAAFVNFGGGRNGFLQIDEVHPEYWLIPHDSAKGPKYPLIQKVLKAGQEVLVQVVKEPSGNKGAFLTTWVSLAGRFLVLTPGQEQIGVSRKVEEPEERARLKELLGGIQPGENMGVIIRTVSEGAGKTSIQKDLQFLKRLWKDIRKRIDTEKAPCLIYEEADLAARAVRDYLAEDIQEIWVDTEQTLESIRETTSLIFPRRPDMVKIHRDPRQTLWERFNLQKQLLEVTSREVMLPSGGRLVFDQTEALMAIDINSGRTQGKSNFEAMVFRTNMEAAEAIARHLRLRDIGGQVVIDFIEMRDRNHCREVEKKLRAAMRLDRARHDVGHISAFGLLELVRQRIGTSAISISSELCPHCHGTGLRRNMEWQALFALRDLQGRLSKTTVENGASHVFLYETGHELGLYLLNKKRDRLAELESKFAVHIEITPK